MTPIDLVRLTALRDRTIPSSKRCSLLTSWCNCRPQADMERGVSWTPGPQWLWSSLVAGAPGLGGAATVGALNYRG